MFQSLDSRTLKNCSIYMDKASGVDAWLPWNSLLGIKCETNITSY